MAGRRVRVHAGVTGADAQRSREQVETGAFQADPPVFTVVRRSAPAHPATATVAVGRHAGTAQREVPGAGGRVVLGTPRATRLLVSRRDPARKVSVAAIRAPRHAPHHESHPVRAPFVVVLVLVAVILLVFCSIVGGSFYLEVMRFLDRSPSERALWLLVGGAATIVVAAFLILRRPRT